ncbi:hypothetical protein [Euzebya tangerina]|uniref:hypothetical protein n=1 Tax=Euzebya tangerina TaxID=591198 RepID=UPI000E3168AD|nr:hypothetical protein [Euzebya tangerina]
MASHHDLEPVEPREAFEEDTLDARYSQAAVLLSVGAAVSGVTDMVPTHESFAMPDLHPLAGTGPVPLPDAVAELDVAPHDYLTGQIGRIPSDEAARLTRNLFDGPGRGVAVNTAAALVEAGMHNTSPLVRAAAATAALDTTGPREDVIAELEEAAQARDTDTRELARTGLYRANPRHPLLDRYVVNRPEVSTRRRRSNTAVLSHGTWAARSRWWRPGGDFYTYLDGLTPPLHVHDESYMWSGAYSAAARDLAADDLVDWVAAQGLDRPDFFAHSHGATVGNLATQRGLRLGRLVVMGLPVHSAWLPDLAQVDQLIDVRVRADLVILADRGGQRLPASRRADDRVIERRHGWFSHASTHEPAYWARHDIPSSLLVPVP